MDDQKPVFPGARAFRRADAKARQAMLARLLPGGQIQPALGVGFADAMVENAWAVMEMPLGLCTELVLDGCPGLIPMATEEPSVIAAANHGAGIICRHGTLKASCGDPLMKAHVYAECPNSLRAPALLGEVQALLPGLRTFLEPGLQSMKHRGGGLRDLSCILQDNGSTPALIKLELVVDVRDAMGANLLNTLAETTATWLEEHTGLEILLSILSNRPADRLARAEFSIEVDQLPTNGRHSQSETARRILAASNLAALDPDRALTHNKGIMNGISALALATGNDTRALEAGVHEYAGRTGTYRGLSRYRVEGSTLKGEIELPLNLAVTGGACSFHPRAQECLALLGNPDARQLARIAAALGLAQNLAALLALVGPGIQKGHMACHARRLAWKAGVPLEHLDQACGLVVQHQAWSDRQVQSLLASHGFVPGNPSDRGLPDGK